MMKINRNNYETFFIDYLDGNLDEKIIDDFIEFLQQNPDLKEELSLFEPVSIKPDEITFNKKDSLYREIYDVESKFNKAAIASLEGDISASEKAEFEKYLSNHPEKQKEADLFRLTKLHPDQSVVFGKKEKLYHRRNGKTVLMWSMQVAAVLVLALSVYLFSEKSADKLNNTNQVATVDKKDPEKKENSPAVNETHEIHEKKVQKEIKPAEKKEPQNSEIKKEKPKAEHEKSLRENSQGRLGKEDLALLRTPVETPDELKSITASLYTELPKSDLAIVKLNVPEVIGPFTEEKLLVDVVKEKTGIDKLSFNKITKAGLSLVASLSGEKFNYETNSEGKVTELKYDSRILAFSIPTKNETDEK